MLPSWIRSRKDMPRPMYFFAIETTRRRFASVSLCLASSSPASIALARVTSCSALSSATRPISLRYIRTGSSSETESIASIVAIRSSSISTTSSKSFSPSETSTPMSRNTLKIRKSWSGSSSTSGKPARMSSGLRNPCSLPLTMRASAASTIGSSERLSFPPPGGGAFLGVGASLRLALAMSQVFECVELVRQAVILLHERNEPRLIPCRARGTHLSHQGFQPSLGGVYFKCLETLLQALPQGGFGATVELRVFGHGNRRNQPLLVRRELGEAIGRPDRCLRFDHLLQPSENSLVGRCRETDRLQLPGDLRNQVGPLDQEPQQVALVLGASGASPTPALPRQRGRERSRLGGKFDGSRRKFGACLQALDIAKQRSWINAQPSCRLLGVDFQHGRLRDLRQHRNHQFGTAAPLAGVGEVEAGQRLAQQVLPLR